jgi:hypothetical protein
MVDQVLREGLLERRVSVASTFVSMLIALAFSEMVLPVKASIAKDGFTLGTSLLVVVFFLTTLRNWIGNELYLRRPDVVSSVGKIWLFDFIVIVVESIILVFLATTCSETAAREARVGFVEILLILYAVDVLWVLSMWARQVLLGWLQPSIQTNKIPWWWAGQNFLLIVLIGPLGWLAGDFYSPEMLMWLTFTHFGAFIHSVILYDFCKLLHEGSGAVGSVRARRIEVEREALPLSVIAGPPEPLPEQQR